MPHVHVFGSGGDVPLPPLLLLLLLANALDSATYGIEWNGMVYRYQYGMNRENK